MSYSERLQRLYQLLKDSNFDCYIIDDPINLLYMTGLKMETARIFVTQNEAKLIVDARYYEYCKKASPIPPVLASPKVLLDLISEANGKQCKTLAFDKETTTYQTFQDLEQALLETKSSMKLVPSHNLVKRLRSIKEPEEIEILRQAADLGCQGFDFVCNLLQEGITEAEVAKELEIYWKKQGATKPAFDPIIAFGVNSSMPHHRTGDQQLRREQPVLIDIGVNYMNYHSDMTRVIFFGFAEPKILSIYSIVQKAQQAALDMCRPGTTVGEIDEAARNIIVAEGYGEHFTHSVGHGIGLEIHEWPTLRNRAPDKEVVLAPGMVIAVEPGIYLPGIGGVRIEDTVIITKTGHDNLTKRTKNPVFK